MNCLRTAAVFLTLTAALFAAAETPQAGMGRYRVTVELMPGDDPAALARQLAATYRGTVVETATDGFVVTMSDAAARLLAGDARVTRIETASPVTAREVQTDDVGTWYLGPYAYDGGGNIKSVGTPAGTDYFVYDALSRLRSGTAGPGKAQEYTFDDFGNIKTIRTDYGATVSLGVNEANNRIDNASYAVSGTYDNAGNLITYNGVDSFAYDGLGMVKEATVDNARQLYIYGPGNERLITVNMLGSVQGRSEWTLRDTSGAVLRRFAREGSTWTWEEDYIYRGDALLASEIPTAARTLHFHLDHLGTPRLITGNGGVQVAKHDYYPFGREVTSTSQDAEKMKFTGHERDSVNLDYMHARFARPYIGRFTSPDPVVALELSIAMPQTWNRYSYGANNPMKYTDPTGEVINVSQLSLKDLQDLLASLLYLTGNEYGVDLNGNLYVVRYGAINSPTATCFMDEAIGSTRTYDVISKNDNDYVHSMHENNGQIVIDFDDFKDVTAPPGIDKEAFGLGSNFIHELAHAHSDMRDPFEVGYPGNPAFDKKHWDGPTIQFVNQIHREAGLPLRGPTYSPQETSLNYQGRLSIPFIDPRTGKTVYIKPKLTR